MTPDCFLSFQDYFFFFYIKLRGNVCIKYLILLSWAVFGLMTLWIKIFLSGWTFSF